MGCSHMRSPFPSYGQTDMTENITFPQLHWWAVIIHFAKINEDLSFELASPLVGMLECHEIFFAKSLTNM